jgi:glycosyl transferase family 2
MKLVMGLRTRDQADIVEAVLAFHLNAGVDYVIATDHRSEDGTVDILREYARQGVLRLIEEHGDEIRGSEWRTTMARMATTTYGADWTFSCDGDEFFWPRGGSLADVLAAVPRQFGVVRAPWRVFLPRSDGSGCFAERMTVRFAHPAAAAHPHSPYKPNEKIVHRGDPSVVVQAGNHRLLSGGLEAVPGWHPIEVLHFPTRSSEQHERKMGQWSRAGRDWRFAQVAAADASGAFEALAIPDDVLAAGVAAGVLTVDTRLRNALRRLRPRESGGRARFLFPPESPGLSFAPAFEDDDRDYRSVVAALDERAVQRLQRRIDDVAAKVAAHEPLRSAGGRVG